MVLAEIRTGAEEVQEAFLEAVLSIPTAGVLIKIILIIISVQAQEEEAVLIMAQNR